MKTYLDSLSVTGLVMIIMITISCSNNKIEKASASLAGPSLDIHTAAYLGDINSIQQHIQAGTDLDKKDQYGSTPLIVAITFDKTDVAKALIEGGADLSVTNNDGSAPLHIAAFFCKAEIVQLLLDNDVDTTLRNNYGSTALESVAGPFEQVKPIYEQLDAALKPLGLKMDYKYLEETRPQIAAMLR